MNLSVLLLFATACILCVCSTEGRKNKGWWWKIRFV